MNRSVLMAIGLLLVFAEGLYAQPGPPPPAPVIEGDLRDNTIRMRSIELERVKRESRKLRPEEDAELRVFRFKRIKENFEKIQLLQDSIILAYTTKKRIDYKKISKAAATIKKKSQWLDEHLFGAQAESGNTENETQNTERASVRDLIIKLDEAIGNFVSSPIFKDARVVDSRISEEARLELQSIITFSNSLLIEAKRKN